jgi:hypothetical protein
MTLQPLTTAFVNNMLGKIAFTIVFKPVKANVGIGGYKIKDTIIAKINSRDAKGIIKAGHDEIFSKFDVLGDGYPF